jgi:hypothetical protein
MQRYYKIASIRGLPGVLRIKFLSESSDRPTYLGPIKLSKILTKVVYIQTQLGDIHLHFFLDNPSQLM